MESHSIEIKSDELLFEWFELNVDNEIVHIVPRIYDFEGLLQCSLTKHRCHPFIRNRVPTIERATNVRGKSTSKKKDNQI